MPNDWPAIMGQQAWSIPAFPIDAIAPDKLMPPPANPTYLTGTLREILARALSALTPEYLQQPPLTNMPTQPGKIPQREREWSSIAPWAAIDAASLFGGMGVTKAAAPLLGWGLRRGAKSLTPELQFLKEGNRQSLSQATDLGAQPGQRTALSGEIGKEALPVQGPSSIGQPQVSSGGVENYLAENGFSIIKKDYSTFANDRFGSSPSQYLTVMSPTGEIKNLRLSDHASPTGMAGLDYDVMFGASPNATKANLAQALGLPLTQEMSVAQRADRIETLRQIIPQMEDRLKRGTSFDYKGDKQQLKNWRRELNDLEANIAEAGSLPIPPQKPPYFKPQ